MASVYSENTFRGEHLNDAWSKIVKFVPPGKRILDVGCSSGRLGAALKTVKNGYVVGIDINQEDIELAKQNLDKAFVVDLEKDSLTKLGKFDVIIMADVIEHLVNPVKVLKKLKVLLVPNGRLVFSIPNMANVTTRIELLKGRFEYKDFGLLDRTHLRFYDKFEVNRVFAEAGLEVVKTNYTSRELPKEILEKDLAEVGIKLTDKLAKYLYDTDALVYQFIGYTKAVDNPTKKMPLTTTSHLDSISREIAAIQQQHASEIIERDKTIADLKHKFETIRDSAKIADEERNQLKHELEAIKSSKGWKLLSRLYKIKHFITHLNG